MKEVIYLQTIFLVEHHQNLSSQVTLQQRDLQTNDYNYLKNTRGLRSLKHLSLIKNKIIQIQDPIIQLSLTKTT